MMARDTRVAFLWAWLILSALAGLAALAPHLVPAEILAEVGGALRHPHPGGAACGLCGMTRAQIALARGEFAEAQAAHGGALAFAGLCLANGLTASAFVALRARRLSIRLAGGRVCRS